MSTPLKNQHHERFAQEIATGKTAVQAYRAVAGNDNPGGETMGSRWLPRTDVQNRVADLIRDRTAAATMTAAERRQIVAEIARDKTVPPTVRLNATIIDAKHAGEFMARSRRRAKPPAPFPCPSRAAALRFCRHPATPPTPPTARLRR